MREEYDVIVVGAGPAGSTAAKTAATGSNVLLIEKRQEVGDPVRCAEGVAKESLSKFVEPEKKWIASEINRGRIYAPDGTVIELSGELLGDEVGYVLERQIFDRELAKSAARSGAHVMVRTRATGLIIEDNVVRGIKVNRLGEDFEIRSKIVVGADGVESKVGRWAGINTTLKLKDIESCAQYLMTNIDTIEDSCDFYLGSQAPGGYLWTFPKGNFTANVGLGVLASKLGRKRPIDYLNEFVEKKYPDAQPVQLVIGGVPVSDRIRTTITNGLILVGDAARHTDPITGGGIINGMKGGRIAGEVAIKAVSQNNPSIQVLKEYESRWHESFGKTLERNYKIKEFFTKLSDEELNKLARSLQGVKIEEMNVTGITKHLLKMNPELLLSFFADLF